MDYYRIILPPSSLRPMQRSFTSSAFLFPHKDLWQSNEIFASGPDRNYTSANIKQFFDDIKYPTGWLQYQKIAPALSLDPPGVEVSLKPSISPNFRSIASTELMWTLLKSWHGLKATSQTINRQLCTETEMERWTLGRWRRAKRGMRTTMREKRYGWLLKEEKILGPLPRSLWRWSHDDLEGPKNYQGYSRHLVWKFDFINCECKKCIFRWSV